jgi:hypothetical protein
MTILAGDQPFQASDAIDVGHQLSDDRGGIGRVRHPIKYLKKKVADFPAAALCSCIH